MKLVITGSKILKESLLYKIIGLINEYKCSKTNVCEIDWKDIDSRLHSVKKRQ